MARYQQKLDGVIQNIRNDDSISERDRENLLEFHETLLLLRDKYATATRYKLVQHAAMLAGCAPTVDSDELPDVDLSGALDDREIAEDIVRWIHTRYDNPESNADMRKALRAFAKHLTNGDDVPETVSWVSSNTSNEHDPTPEPRDMLSWAEVQEVIDACLNARDAALVAVCWDSGARGGEMLDLTIGDITDHNHGKQITVHGKTGQRTVTLIPSVPFLNKWLADHPGTADPDAPLWSKLSTPDQPSYETLWKALNRAGERSVVDKPVNFTNLRRSSASHLASRGMNQAHLEEHHGWQRGSDVAARYIAVFGDEADDELARIHGKEVETQQSKPIGPIECPRCGKETPRDEDFCVWCNQALDQQAVAEIEEAEEQIGRDLLALAKNNPDLLEEAQFRERILARMGADPEFMERAESFIEATDG